MVYSGRDVTTALIYMFIPDTQFADMNMLFMERHIRLSKGPNTCGRKIFMILIDFVEVKA